MRTMAPRRFLQPLLNREALQYRENIIRRDNLLSLEMLYTGIPWHRLILVAGVGTQRQTRPDNASFAMTYDPVH